MTSDESWSNRLRKITELERPDHHFLREEDDCYFFGNYTAHERYDFSDTNQLIANLKKKPSTRGTFQWTYKLRAISKIGRALNENIRADNRGSLAIVPIPPSKMRDDPEYDNRMLEVARSVQGIAINECIQTVANRCAAHAADVRPSMEELRASLDYGPEPSPDGKEFIFLLDDVLTTGRSFRVCKSMILEAQPNIKVVGLFVARVARPALICEFENLDF